MKTTIACFLLSLGIAAGIVTTVRYAAAQPAAGSAVVIQPPSAGSGSSAAATPATEGSGSAVTPAPAPTAPAPAILTPQAEDISVLAKLWKNGAFLSLGIIAAYLGLVVWSKLDKRHAFYIATGLGGLTMLVEAIRKGDAPTASAVFSTMTTTAGVMIAGPGHVPATPKA